MNGTELRFVTPALRIPQDKLGRGPVKKGIHFRLVPGLRPPWTEVILGMQEQFPVRWDDGTEKFVVSS